MIILTNGCQGLHVSILFTIDRVDTLDPIIKIVLTFILVFGAILRSGRFPPIWVTDSARDLLMGLHIAQFKELPIVGHWAYGVSFPYPPYYYYFLGFLSLLSTNLFFIFAVFVVIQLLGVLALFKIGSLLFDKKTGLLCGFFYSISAIMVLSGSMIETVFFNIPIFLSSFYTFLLFYKTKRMLFAVLSFIFIFVSVSIHASSFPFLFLYVVITIHRLRKEKLHKIFLLITFFFTLSVVFYLPVIHFYGLPGFLNHLFDEGKALTGSNIFFAFLSNWEKLLRLLFFSQTQAIIYFVISLTILLYLLLRHNIKKIKGLIIPVGCIGYLLAASSVTQKVIYLHYLFICIPFVYLGISYLLVENLKSRSWFQRSITLSVMAVVVFIFVKIPDESVYWVSGNSQTYEKLADLIWKDAQTREKASSNVADNFYQVFVMTPHDDYKNSFLIWYFLEKKYQQKLIRISNTNKDFVPLTDTKVVYLVCDLRSAADFYTPCLEQYSKKDPSKKYEGLLKQIGKDYALHVFM